MSSSPESSTQAPAWQHPDPDTRLQAIDSLVPDDDPSGIPSQTQKQLAELAVQDEDPRVRAAAARRISLGELLEDICRQSKQRDKTVYRHCKQQLDAIAREQALREERREAAEQCCQRLEQLATAVAGPLTGARLDYLQQQWKTLREHADESLRERFDTASRGAGDKAREFERRREEALEQEQQHNELETVLRETKELIHALPSPAGDGERQALAGYARSLEQMLERCADGAGAELVRECRQLLQQINDYLDRHRQARDQAQTLYTLREELAAASSSDGPALDALADHCRNLAMPAHGGSELLPGDPLLEQYRSLTAELERKLQENRDWQKSQVDKVEARIMELDRAIEEGHVRQAQSLWDRSHNAIARLEENRQKPLLERLAPMKPRINELLDWKRFAATEKKRELIEHMRQLRELQMHPPEKADKIRRLQEEWRSLGPAENNEELWKEFSSVAGDAFEPCKEYFQQRKELMRFNRRERGKICEQLEVYADSLDSGDIPVDVSRINQLEDKARREWKQYAPVEQKRIRDLQKRFNNVLKRLRQHRGKTLQQHAERKQELVEKARELTRLDNLQQAISQAKQLQEQWKQIGPAPFKQERALWHAFRENCDVLFKQRDEKQQEQRQAENEALARARQCLDRLAELLKQPDEDFAQSKQEASALRRQFRDSLPERPTAASRSLQQQFRRLSDRYDKRQRATPDRKQLELRRQIQVCDELCREYEDTPSESGSDTTSGEKLQERWQALDKPEDGNLAGSLQRRVDRLVQISAGNGDPGPGPDQVAMEARQLCVDMEILAGIDSPREDKSLRMQQQLNQLQQDFGRQTHTRQQILQQLRDLELRFLTLGPLEPSLRQSMQHRVHQALEAAR